MNISRINLKQSSPYILSAVLVTLFFVLCLRFPYSVQVDIAYQIKAIQQWLTGESTILNSLVIPDPTDLSKGVQSWILWWAPGVSIFFLPLIAIGLPTALAVRLTAYILVIIGCFGWIKVAKSIQTNLLTQLVIAFTLPIYTIGNALSVAVAIDTGDILPFAAIPWLVLYTLHVSSLLQRQGDFGKNLPIYHLILLGLFLGSVYWLKYSAFCISVGIFLYLLSIFLLNQNNYSLSEKLLIFGSSGIAFVSPVILLTLIHRSLTGIDTAFELYQRYSWGSFGVKGTEILVTILGTLGLCLFQTSDLARSLVEGTNIFSEWKFDDLAHKREALSLLLGMPGTVLASWCLWRTRQFYSKQILLLWFCITLIPLLALLYLSIKVGFNYLADPIVRYSSAFIGFFQILLIASFIQLVLKFKDFNSGNNLFSRFLFSCVLTVALLIIFVIPNSYILHRFFVQKYPWMMQFADMYKPTQALLIQPLLSTIDPQSVVQQVNSLVISSRDVIVLNIPASCVGASLEFQQRVMSIAFDGPLSPPPEKAQMGFKTSEDLRIILVTSSSAVETAEGLQALKSQFPQATQWTSVPPSEYSLVSIWFSDIKVSD